MRRKNYSPVLIFLIVLGLAVLLLLARAFQLQIIERGRFKTLSQKNIVRLVPQRAARGKIYDRFGQTLAYSQPSFSLTLIPTSLTDKAALTGFLSAVLKIPADQIVPYLDTATGPPLETALKADLTKEELIVLEENRWRFPEIQIQTEAKRLYPEDSLAAHTLGYVGKITPEEINASQEKGLDLFDVIGKAGLELYYDDQLRGKNGGQQIQVDAQGRPVKILEDLPSQAGDEIYLTIDTGLQKAAEEALGDNAGSVVILDPKSGEVLALVSHPNFDPNIFVEPLSAEKWRRQHQGRFPFHNRTLNPYPPGSIFKIVTAAGALEKNLVNAATPFYCPGYLQLGNRKAKCWKTHGSITFLDAIYQSCDVTFYQLGLKLGIDVLHDLGKDFGLGQETGIDLPYDRTGLIANRAWKEKNWKQPWYPGDTINLAIGQGFLQATPLQTAGLIEAAANNGRIFRPFLVRQIRDSSGQVVLQNKPQPLTQVNASASTWEIIRHGMTLAVAEGTAMAAKVEGLTVAGKTGTAEDPPRPQPHAWFGCYAPVEDPQLVVLVFVEQGGGGGAVAAPIAGQILRWWKANRLDQPPPPVVAPLETGPKGRAKKSGT